MASPLDDPELRRLIYEQEKRRIEAAAPTFSRTTKILVTVYLIGCLLLYFGISNAALEFLSTRTWRLKPEHDLIEVLGNSAIELMRPFLAAAIALWAVFIPVAIPATVVWWLWSWGAEIIRFLKRW